MGPLLKNLEGSVTKKSKGFIFLNKEHSLIRKKSTTQQQAKKVNRGSCEQCRMCTDLCPRYLLGHNMQPHKNIRMQAYNLDDFEGQQAAQLCVQCNLCDLFSCPIGIHPMYANNYFRTKLLNEGKKYTASKTEFEVRKNRDFRLVPTKRLIARLGLYNFDRPAPLVDELLEVEQVVISTRQHIGAPAKVIVNVGDKVLKGQIIGTAQENALGANIHSSIDGTVVQADENYVTIRRD